MKKNAEVLGPALLSPSDPDPVLTHGADRTSRFLIVSDHAGNAVPARLNLLGLPAERFEEHIAWDPNSWRLAACLADALGAPALGQAYSRLVIDANRRPEAEDSIAEVSDGVPIPGNSGLSPDDRALRVHEILQPYQDRIAAELRRSGSTRPGCIVSVHTFTPRLASGRPRPWHVGVISGPDGRIRRRVFDYLISRATDLIIGDNEPYTVNMATDYTIPVHAEGNKIAYVEFELRNDKFGGDAERSAICNLLANALRAALDNVGD